MQEKIKQEAPATFSEAWNKGLQIGLELNAAKAQMRETIAHRIKSCRLEARMTQEELGNRINVNYLTYRGYENCKSDIPIVCLVRIADVFGVTMDYLTGRTEDKKATQADSKSKDENFSMEERIAQLEKAIAMLTK